jgi:hypothetical protein
VVGRKRSQGDGPAMAMLIEMLRICWKTQSKTFPLPNGRLAKLGVTRNVKRRVLADLERAGMIRVERPARKSPFVTLVSL